MFRATKVASYLEVMRKAGIGPKQLLAGSAIDPRQVPDPDYLISPEQYETVVGNMMRLSGKPGIAFELGDAIRVGELGILGYAMLSAKTLQQSMGVWMEYSRTILGNRSAIESYRKLSPGYEITLLSPGGLASLLRFETEETLVQGVKLIREITGVTPLIGHVHLAYPEPPYGDQYRHFFRCPVTFGAPATRFRVMAPNLDAPIRTGSDELFDICARHCREVMRAIPDAGMLRGRLRNLFLASPGDLPDLRRAGAALGMSSSSLRARLGADGQRYQAIKDEFRYDLAREYLRSGHMSAKQVAYLLGFASPSVFCRAFKGWSGITVGEFLDSPAKENVNLS
jgi:AraC-like DNA-binding protein